MSKLAIGVIVAIVLVLAIEIWRVWQMEQAKKDGIYRGGQGK